jgi:hypothetical protein
MLQSDGWDWEHNGLHLRVSEIIDGGEMWLGFEVQQTLPQHL